VPRLPLGRGQFYEALRGDLIAYAEHEFRLARRDENGRSEREVLEGLAERRRKKDPSYAMPELKGPPLPAAGRYLWRWYRELSAQRGSTGFGPAAIGFQDIAAWARLTGVRPAPWEVRIIVALDVLWRSITSEKPEPAKQDRKGGGR
jgi:hypothetical protein